ncbi:MAG: dihydroorotase [Cyanobacteria bacterium P01_E01_bin.42]
MNLLLRQVRVLDPLSNCDRIADVWLKNGKIEAIEEQIDKIAPETTIQSGENLILAPGLTDLYSSNNDPGYEERETLISLSKAALAGGFTRLTLLPNTVPPLDNPAGLTLLRQKAPDRAPHLQFWGALTQNLEGEQMVELAELADAGVVGFSDGKAIANWGVLRRLLEYAKPLGKPIAIVPTSRQLRDNGVMREGSLSMPLGLPGDPAFSETAALAALLEIVAVVRTPVHIMRVSTGRGVELIAEAKRRDLPVTASTTWLHLLLDTEAVGSYDPSLRLDPALGNQSDRVALADGVKSGTIDAIAIDHSPYTYEEKTVSFAEAPPGAIGLEFALPLLWQNLVVKEDWTGLQLWRALSVSPQICLGQKPLACAVGETVELVLFDPQKAWIVNSKTLFSQSLNTSWLGKEIQGKVLSIWNKDSLLYSSY